jgi:hypothetical protein
MGARLSEPIVEKVRYYFPPEINRLEVDDKTVSRPGASGLSWLLTFFFSALKPARMIGWPSASPLCKAGVVRWRMFTPPF